MPPEHGAVPRDAHRGHRVGDEDDAAGGRPEDQGHDLPGDVLQVGDHPDGQPGVGQGGPGGAGLAVPERALRVEDVRDHAGAGVGGGVHLRGGRRGVPDRDEHPGGREPGDRLEGVPALGGEGHDRRRRPPEQDVERLRRRVAHERGIVGPVVVGRQEGALDVGPEDARAVHVLARGGLDVEQRRREPGRRRRDEGRGERGHRAAQQGGPDRPPVVRPRLGEVDAVGAVDLQVEEPGREDAVGQHDLGGGPAADVLAGEGHGADPVALQGDDARAGQAAAHEQARSAHERRHRVLTLPRHSSWHSPLA